MHPIPGLPRYPAHSDHRFHGPGCEERFIGAGVTQPVAQIPFLARLQTVDLGGVRVIRLRHTPARVDHRMNLTTDLPPGLLLVGTHRRGQVQAQQQGAPVILQAGELSMVRSDRPFQYRTEKNVDFTHLMLPISLLGPASERFLLARPTLRTQSPLGKATAAYLARLVFLLLAESPFPQGTEAVTAGLALLRAALAEGDNSALSPSHTAQEHLRHRALTLIEDAHREQNLTVAGIASALRVSTRQLQRAFSGAVYGPAETLNRRRAEAVAEALQDRSLTVSAAAQLAGFRSDSAMRHQFQARYGISPTESRSLAAGSTPWHDAPEWYPTTVAG